MDPVVLRNKTNSGDSLEATFQPDRGMVLSSYKWAGQELIDEGILIAPRFQSRIPEIIPQGQIQDSKDPFPYGIARYVSWSGVECTEQKIRASLTGKDQWKGTSLSTWEGQNFSLRYCAELTAQGLNCDLSVVSDNDSLVGLSCNFPLEGKRSILINGTEVNLDSSKGIDDLFFPFPSPLEGRIVLNMDTHFIQLIYRCHSQENSWRLYRPENSSVISIQPMSAKDPYHPNLTVSSIQIFIERLEK